VLSPCFAFASKSSNVEGSCFKKKYLRRIKPFTFVGIICIVVFFVTTLALGLRPRQGLVKVWDKREAREAHLILLGVQENVRE
jgi:hypothetical protein